MKDKKIKTQAIAKPYTLTSRCKKERELQSFLRSTQTQKRKQEMLLLSKKKVRRWLQLFENEKQPTAGLLHLGVFEFLKFTGKHLYQSLFLITLQATGWLFPEN